jgi:hypothetical protein
MAVVTELAIQKLRINNRRARAEIEHAFLILKLGSAY